MLLGPWGKAGQAGVIEAMLRQKLKTDISGNDRVQDALNNGLLDTDYNTCAVALGLQSWSGSAFNKPASFLDIGLTDGAEAFLEQLKKGPLWVSRYVHPGYHIVLATGYTDNGNGYIIHNNPFPGPKDAIQVTTTTANHFVKLITNARASVQRASWT
ncbi:MAG: hypothetical protein DWI22_19285 [Planctomycetota bacterium]|nr:MAG: hypothetical protein DWI22_19285 [Planctomycetota bacterium]